MARRYGQKVKVERTWKKITRMNLSELRNFKKHLESQHAQMSDVYNFLTKCIDTKEYSLA